MWLAIRAHHRQFVTDQRMTDAVDGGGKLFRNACRRVRVVVAMTVRSVPLHAADQRIGELGEHDALIFAFIQHSRRLEDIFRAAGKAGCFQVVDMEVVVAGPDRVDRGQCHVFVGAAVACNEVLEQVDVGVGVEQQGVTATHEVAGHAGNGCLGRSGVQDHAIGIEDAGGISLEVDVAIRRVEDRIGVPMMLDQFPQGRQQFEVRVRGIIDTLQEMCTNPVVAIAFAQQLPDEFVRTIGLVLIDEGRCLVDVLRHATLGAGDHSTPCQVSWVVRVGSMADTRTTNLDCTVATLRQKVEAVVEVLPEGHEEDIAVIGILRQAGFLSREHVADRTRIEAVEHRIDRHVVGNWIEAAVVRGRDADERRIGSAVLGVPEIVALAAQGAKTEDVFGFAARRRCTIDDGVQCGKISGCKRHAAWCHHIVEGILGLLTDELVAAPSAMEHDAVPRRAAGHIHRLIAGRADDLDRIRIEIGGGKITNDVERIGSAATVEHEVVDARKFGDDFRRCPDGPRDDDFGHGRQPPRDGRDTEQGQAIWDRAWRVDVERLVFAVASNAEQIDARRTILGRAHDVMAVAGKPADRITATVAENRIVAEATCDVVCPRGADDDVGTRRCRRRDR